MAVIQKIKSLVGVDGAGASRQSRYRCPECETEFDSYKQEGRAFCTECMNKDVELVEEA